MKFYACPFCGEPEAVMVEADPTSDAELIVGETEIGTTQGHLQSRVVPGTGAAWVAGDRCVEYLRERLDIQDHAIEQLRADVLG